MKIVDGDGTPDDEAPAPLAVGEVAVVRLPVDVKRTVVQRPGRVDVAFDLVKLMLGVRSYGAAGKPGSETSSVDGEHSGFLEPTLEFADMKAAAFRTLSAYLTGVISDEVDVDLSLSVEGRSVPIHVRGTLDETTGRVMGPRVTEGVTAGGAAPLEPVEAPTNHLIVQVPDRGGVPCAFEVAIPLDVDPYAIVSVGINQAGTLAMLRLKDGTSVASKGPRRVAVPPEA